MERGAWEPARRLRTFERGVNAGSDSSREGLLNRRLARGRGWGCRPSGVMFLKHRGAKNTEEGGGAALSVLCASVFENPVRAFPEPAP